MADPAPPDLKFSADADASSPDTLPVLLTRLLHDVSVECARVDGWAEHKQTIQRKIKGDAEAAAETETEAAAAAVSAASAAHAAAAAATAAAASSASFDSSAATAHSAASSSSPSAPLSFGSLPAFPPSESASALPAAPSSAASSAHATGSVLAAPPAAMSAASAEASQSAASAASDDALPSSSLSLLRQLSDAAALGVISHSTKVEIKNLLLNARVSALAPTRLVRGRTESGEEIIREQTIDTSRVDPEQAKQMQQEEREAMEAIYEGLVTFGESMETEEQDEGEAASKHEEREEQKLQQRDGSQYEDEEQKSEDEDEEDQEDDGEDAEESSDEAHRDEDHTTEPADATAAATAASAASASSSAPAPSASAIPAAAASAPVAPAPVPVLCRTVTVDVLPYPASSARNPVSAVLRFTLPPLYPFVRPSFRLVAVKGELLQSDGMMMGTAINEKINQIYAKGEPLTEDDARPCLFDIVTEAQEFLIEYVHYLEDAAYHKRIAEEAAVRAAKQARLDAVRAEQLKHAAALMQKDAAKLEWSHVDLQPLVDGAGKGPQPEPQPPEQQSLDDFSALNPSPKQLAAHIHSFDRNFKARCGGVDFEAQSIVSPLLVYRFMKARDTMRVLGQPSNADIAFHGTSSQHVQSIATHGLVIPGQTNLNVTHARNTGFYGLGIYVSPYPSYAASYGGLGNLFACLVLRGRSYEAGFSMGRALEPGYQSHHDASGQEWVIFSAACVLPIYLLTRRNAPVIPPEGWRKDKPAKAKKVKKVKMEIKKPKAAPLRR